MKRNCSLEEISDGKKYDLNDMVKVGCDDCKGCSACCHNMGNSIILDPYDCHQLMKNLNYTFEELLMNHVELHVVDDIILPSLKMSGQLKKCNFLNEKGRCSIHPFRPGFCRIFPLGRLYEDGEFTYILQVDECKKGAKTKVKVSKWIDIPNLKQNQKFVNDWHYFLKNIQKNIESESEETIRKLMMYLLNTFYVKPYQEDMFYEEFYQRLEHTKESLGI